MCQSNIVEKIEYNSSSEYLEVHTNMIWFKDKMHSIDRESHILLHSAMIQGYQGWLVRHRDYLIAVEQRLKSIRAH